MTQIDFGVLSRDWTSPEPRDLTARSASYDRSTVEQCPEIHDDAHRNRWENVA